MFIHLHTHSCYSFLEGLPSPQELASAAARSNMPALALTDTSLLTGAIEFIQACHQEGIKPILGLELTLKTPDTYPFITGMVVLLAANLEGWANLCRLSSSMETHSLTSTVNAISIAKLETHSAGLICLTGGKQGLISEALGKGEIRVAEEIIQDLREIFSDRLYLEIQLRSDEDKVWVTQIIQLANRVKVPWVATNDVHYLHPDQVSLQRLVTAIRFNQTVYDLPDQFVAPTGSHFTSPREMIDRFATYPEAIHNSLIIADRCQLELDLDKPRFPTVEITAGQTVMGVLRQKAIAGALERYGTLSSEVQSRLNHELAVIEEKEYAPLFLIMEEIISYARQIGVPISSRGSAASSLVAYCLGITNPDPMRLNLYFERFLNPARSVPPDIDTDLCSRRRDEVIDFVYERFGRERVAMVGTINRFRRRSALRETAKAYGLTQDEISKLVNLLPFRWHRARRDQDQPPFAELIHLLPDPRYQQIIQHAAELIGLPDHLSIHPGGIVISPGQMTDLVPTQMAAKGMRVSQFDLESIERIGLVKIDLLGIRGLTVLGDVAESIKLKSGVKYTQSTDVLESIPLVDEATSSLIQTGRTIGCFQIESPGMRATLKEIQATTIDDLMVALALYRPGPLTGGLRDAFVRRHRGEEAASQLHPALEPLLSDTYGVILYQEQVLRIAHELGGLSLADADLLRRAMSHFDVSGKMQSLKDKFIEGASLHSGVPPETGERIWQLMAAFAGYGFPKAHAASYALISWKGAWCKAHEPAVFMAAVLANWGGYYGQSVYLMETRRLGLAIRGPHVNYSQREFGVAHLENKPVLFMGLEQVRDLTKSTQYRILSGRPFHSMDDFLSRVDPRPGEAENLVSVGGLDGFGTIPELLSHIQRGGWRTKQMPLFALESKAWEQSADWTLPQRLAAEKVILGVSVSAHELELVSEQIKSAGALTTLEAISRLDERVRVAGMRHAVRRGETESGNRVYWLSLEDLEGMLQVEIPEQIYTRYKSMLSAGKPCILDGYIHMDPFLGEPSLHMIKGWQI